MELMVYINQDEAGKLTISRDGLYTLFEAEAPDSTGLVRLWAHGGGKSACLGVMQPWNGGLRLCRKFSALDMRSFPEPIMYISDCAEERLTENNIHNTTLAAKAEEENEEESLHKIEQDDKNIVEIKEKEDKHKIANIIEGTGNKVTQNNLHKTETDAHACPWPAEPPGEGLLWYTRPDGSLVAFDGISSLVALPLKAHARFPQGVERVIEGKKYLVFRY